MVADFVPPARFAGKTFEDFRPTDPSQQKAVRRLQIIAKALSRPRRSFLNRLVRSDTQPRTSGRGIYLDGGFGVGKTHLLAALWNEVESPAVYLRFDELMYFVGLFGPEGSAEHLGGCRLIAVDEWELDDPGNLKLAIAFLRGALAKGAFVAVTSNTLPLELGAGRFSQKDFRSEIEEIASAFDVIHIGGDDFRKRRFNLDNSAESYLRREELNSFEGLAEPPVFRREWPALMRQISEVHPIRYREVARRVRTVLVDDVQPFSHLASALRWVHFVDSLYDSGTSFGATGEDSLSALFSDEDLAGAYGKKLSRCVSRMREMVGEARVALQRGVSGRDARL